MDSQIVASPVSSGEKDGISRKRTLDTNQNPNPYERSTRKCTQGTQNIVSASCCTSKSSSVLRQPLSDTLFDHCLGNIWNETPEVRRDQFAYINSFGFSVYTIEHTRAKALSWIKKENIFSKRYVFVPIVYQLHWSLLILCHFDESLEAKTRTPCMLFLDSLHIYGARAELEPLIRSFVLDIFQTEGRSESKDLIEQIPLVTPKVPQQRDGKECGIFALYYIYLFLEGASRSFSITNGHPQFVNEDWFTEEEVEQFYEKLESLGLESFGAEEDAVLPDSEGNDEDIEYLGNDSWELGVDI